MHFELNSFQSSSWVVKEITVITCWVPCRQQHMSFIIADGGLERLLRIIGKGSEMVDPKKDQDVRGKLLQLMPQEREPPEDGRLENPRW